MQPYFFPYLGHFALIAHCDRWLVFDITQYTRKSWMSRNRVIHPDAGWNYISVPIANASTSIKTAQAEIRSFPQLAPSLLGKLSHYRKRAPFYGAVERVVSEIFSVPTNSLVTLNVRALEAVCRYLGIRFDYRIASELDMGLPAMEHPGAWAPEISRRLGAKTYINPIGGRSLFRRADFDAAGVALQFLEFGKFAYRTDPYDFIDSLSILDVMMWNDPAAILQAIAAHSKVTDDLDRPGTSR